MTSSSRPTRPRARPSPGARLVAACLAALWLALLPLGAAAQLSDDQRSELPSALQLQQDAAAIDRFFDIWADNAGRAEEALADGSASTGAFEVLREGLAGDRAAARTLADRLAAARDPLQRQLGALVDTSGDSPAPEADGGDALDAPPAGDAVAVDDPPPDDAVAVDAPPPGDAVAVDAPPPRDAVAVDAEALRERIDLLDGYQRRAERAYARADVLIAEIDDLIRSRIADALFTMGPSPLVPARWVAAAGEYAELAVRVFNEVTYNVSERDAGSALVGPLATLGAALVVALSLGLVARRKLIMVFAGWAAKSPTRARRAAASGLAALAGLLMPAAALALLTLAVQQSGVLGPAGRGLAPAGLAGLVFVVLARSLSQAFFSPQAPVLRFAPLGDAEARLGSSTVILLGFGVFCHGIFVEGAREAGVSPATLTIANAVWVTVTAIGLWSLTRFLRPAAPQHADPQDDALPGPHIDDPSADGGRLLRRIAGAGVLALRVAAVGATVLAWAGFLEASDRLLISPILTLGLAVIGMLLFQLISDGVEAYIEGRSNGEDGAGDGLRLIPVLVVFLLGCGALPVVALIWGARPSDIAEVWKIVVDGVDVGGARISPIDAFTFVVVFGIGYTLTRLMQTVLSTSVLPKTRMDAGGRSAIVSGLGYAGFTLAGLFAVSFVGLDLSSLAIVAGALSVGIGFGLQTIVANFVSGIILMVERPVKIGDWIEVGGTHGIVRRISVRATQIETFDRSALILPNSELISGRVVNFTHGNSLGRVIIKVGVAYGTDVREVERILKEAAAAETRALRHPPPQILFMGFGADSLDFEVRLMLRDVLTIIAVTSDMHFEIERRFREAEIEIPFAQRVVHLADPERLGRALRGRRSGDAEAPASDAPPRAPMEVGAGGGDAG